MTPKAVEIDDMLAIAREEARHKHSVPLSLSVAQSFLPLVKEYDLRELKQPEKRVAESVRLVAKALELYRAGFKAYTLVNEVPTWEQVNDHMYILELQQKFARAHNIFSCPKPVIESLETIIGDLRELYDTENGLEKLSEYERDVKPVDWEAAFGAERYTPTLIGRFWKDIIHVKRVSERRLHRAMIADRRVAHV